MAKKVVAQVKLHIPAGKATPQPPVGPALGQAGVNIMEFCKAFNSKTQKMGDATVPVVISVHGDRTFTFVTKSPPAAELLRKAAGLEKGSSEPNRDKVGKVKRSQVEEIAKIKEKDLNSVDMDGAVNILSGTARNMGIEVVDD